MITTACAPRGYFANIDILPTMLAAAGIKYSPDQFDGQSAWKAISSQTDQGRKFMPIEQGFARGVISDDGWKYIRVELPLAKIRQAPSQPKDWSGQQTRKQKHKARQVWRWHPGFFDIEQLYNLNADPEERQNLARERRYFERLEIMRQMLSKEYDLVDGAIVP